MFDSAKELRKIADDLMTSPSVDTKTAGYSYAVDTMVFELTGWPPFNRDSVREIANVGFDFVDDGGEIHDDGYFKVTDIKRQTPPLTYYQEQEMKRKRQAPVTIVTGQIPADSQAHAYMPLLKAFQRMGYTAKQVG